MKPLIPIQDFVPLSFLLLAIALLSHNKTFLKIAMLFTLPVFFCFVCMLWCFILSFFFLLWCGIFIHGLPVQRIWILLLLLIGGVLVLCMTALYVLKQAFFHDWMLALISLFSS